jgi:hypothetical protein
MGMLYEYEFNDKPTFKIRETIMAISTGAAGMNAMGTSIVNPMYTDNNTREVPIKGESFSVSICFTESDLIREVITPDEIKQMLIRDLIKEMMHGNYIEFTKSEDIEKTTFRARVFAVPDSQVRLLRLEGVIE